jgi:hypothetical protein
MPTREEVFKVIDGERDYQDNLKLGPDGRTDGKKKTIGDYLTLIRDYLRKADAAHTGNPGNVPALHQIRKAAAIAVQCLETIGMTRPEVYLLMGRDLGTLEPLFPDIHWKRGPESLSVGDHLTAADNLSSAASNRTHDDDGETRAAILIRKIASVCTHCMQLHGAPRREP